VQGTQRKNKRKKKKKKKKDGGIAMVACFSTLNIHIDKKKLESSIYMYTFNKNWNQKHTRTCKAPCCIVHTSKNLRGRCISAIMLSSLFLSLSLVPI
jgi:hypothetical protein